MKKVISWILALSMCSGMFGNLAYAENTAAIDADIILEDVQAAEALPLDGVELEDDVGGEVKGETEETSIITEEGNSHESITEDSDKESVETIISTDIVETENNANLSVKSIESPNYQVLEATAFESEPEASWELVGNLTRNVEANVSVAIGKYIYVIPKETPDKLYRYDTERNSTILTTVSADVNEVKSAVAKGEYIYVLTDEYLYRINGFSKTWEEVGDASEWKDDEGVLVLFKNTVCFANRKGLYYYDTDLEKWRVYTVFHEEFLNPISAAYADGGRVYIIPEYSNTIYMFDHDMDITKELTLDDWNNILPWYAFIGCGKNGRLYLVGGYKKELVNEDDWMLGPEEEWDNPDYWNTRVVDSSMAVMCDFNDMTIDYMAGFPLESSDHSLTYCNGCVYIMGGDDLLSNGASKVYSLDVKEWDVPEVDDNKIAVGENYYLYLDDDDDVYVYGDNTYGQLGLGDYDFVSEELELPINNSIKSVYTSNSSSAILDYSGRLWMFGKNDSYQLAMEDTTGINTPYKVMDNVVKVSFGNNHVLALSKEGKVYSWGGNEYGELGNVVDGVSWIPREINICDNKIVDIAAGGEHSVALDETGTAYTWGSNSRGQMMEDPSALEYSIISLPIPLENVYSVHASNNYTILIDYSGNVYTLGDNSRGQIGTFLIAEYSTVPCHVTDIKGAQKIATAHDRIYIWDAKNKIYSFGDNVYGLLGASSTDAYNMSVQSIDSKVSITDIWVLNNKTYMRTADEDIYKCGLMTDNEAVEFNLLNIDYPLKITQIDSYRNQTLAIDESGEVIAWGEGYYANGSDSTETYYYPMRIDGIIEPVQVSRGKNHNLVLDANGDVWGWGSNSNNPMGKLDGKVKVATKIDGFENVKKVAAGTEFSIVLKNDGTLWGVGKNDRGQLCREGTTSVTTPIQLTEKTDFIDVSVGESYVAAVATDGIYTWGGNEKGQLGNGTTTDSYTSNKLEVVLENNEKFVSVSAGIDFCMALTNLGNVYTWGDNGSGALGTGNRISHYIPTQNTGLSNIVNIEAGKSSSYAIDNDGKVYGWGYAYDGQFIDYDARILTPKEITQLSDIGITDVALGYDFMVALSNDNKLYSCGSMDNGKLGYYAAKPVLDKSSNLVKDALWLNSVMSELTASPLTENIDLPVKGEYGSKITWISSNDYYIDSEGTVHRPDCYGKDTAVKLYATISNGVDKFTPTYTAIVKQDPTIQPSTDILNRTIGFEYEQDSSYETIPSVFPEIKGVAVTVIDESNGEYQLTVRKDQYVCDSNAKPFFYWTSEQGTFINIEEYTNYRSVLFTIDEDALNQKVKVVVGMGDGNGYIDEKSILIGNASNVESASLTEDITNEEAKIPITYTTGDENISNSVLAVGIDTSSNMYAFDSGASKVWMDSIIGLFETAYTNTEFAIITEDSIGYPVDSTAATASVNMIQSKEYAGDTDAETLLDKSIKAINDSIELQQQANKIVIIFANKISDTDLLNKKIKTAEDSGLSVYVMLLTGDNYTDLSDNIYVFDNTLSLRLNIAEIYDSFYNTAQLMTLTEEDSSGTEIIYTSDFKVDRHMFTGELTFGKAIASVLNIYNCLPLRAEAKNSEDASISYDLFSDYNDAYNIAKRNTSSVSKDTADKIGDFYDELKESYKANGTITKVWNEEVVSKNLRYRFPVILFDDNNTYIITGQTGENTFTVNGTSNKLSIENIESFHIIDTYQYLLEIEKEATQISDNWSKTEGMYENIRFTKPSGYSKNDVSAFCYNATDAKITTEIEGNYYKLSGFGTNIVVRGIKVKYKKNCIPNIYGDIGVYIPKTYADFESTNMANQWYYESAYKATNLGIIDGIKNTADGTIEFQPNIPVKRAEFLKMVLSAAEIDIPTGDDAVIDYSKISSVLNRSDLSTLSDDIQKNYSELKELLNEYTNNGAELEWDTVLKNEDGTESLHWGTKWMNYAFSIGLINAKQYMGLDSENQTVPITGGCEIEVYRCDVAYILDMMFIDSVVEVCVPIVVHKYDEGTVCERNTKWNLGIAFTDQNSSDFYNSWAIYQMYLNGILSGYPDGSFRPLETINRAETVQCIINCLFELNDGLKNIDIIEMGDSNYIDFDLESAPNITQEDDRANSNRFYFVAPKTGYYYINNITGCRVKVKDVNMRDIQGMIYHKTDDEINELGIGKDDKYNIRKGEIVYIEVKTDEGSENYSFNIVQPQKGDLVFAPDRTGTFIYDNCPEYIIKEDLADVGNTALITAENISGEVTVASSHLMRSEAATISTHNWCDCSQKNMLYWDYLFTNNTDEEISVTIHSMGIQTPAYEDNGYTGNKTYDESTCYQAWADYTNTSLLNNSGFIGNGNNGNIYQEYICDSGHWSNLIKEVENVTFSIEPHSSRWLFDGELNFMLDSSGFALFVIFDCTISGPATIQSMAYHSKSLVDLNKLLSGKIYSSDSLRSYENEDPHWKYKEENGVRIQGDDGYDIIIGYFDTENTLRLFEVEYSAKVPPELPEDIAKGEILEIGEKYKGISNSLPYVYAESIWNIDENSYFYTPKIYNRTHFDGVVVGETPKQAYKFFTTSMNEMDLQTNDFSYWLTHINSEASRENNYDLSWSSTSSDMLGLEFSGIKVEHLSNSESDLKTYYFDNYYTSTEKGNQKVIAGAPEDSQAIKMANFSVTEKYKIKIQNNTLQNKKIRYFIGNESGLFFKYSIGETKKSNIRCVLPWNGCNFYEMFNFDILPNEEIYLEFEIVIPNVGVTGLYNVLYAENI